MSHTPLGLKSKQRFSPTLVTEKSMRKNFHKYIGIEKESHNVVAGTYDYVESTFLFPLCSFSISGGSEGAGHFTRGRMPNISPRWTYITNRMTLRTLRLKSSFLTGIIYN